MRKVQEKIEALTLEIEECIPCNIRGSITRASFYFLLLKQIKYLNSIFMIFSTELHVCLNSSTIHTQNARNV
jgi:hypothetical protein